MAMKQLILIFSCYILLLSSCQSKENKAEALIKDMVVQASEQTTSLDGYTPLQTSVTEAYNIPMNNPNCWNIALRIANMSAQNIQEWQANGDANRYATTEVLIKSLKKELQDTISHLDQHQLIGWNIQHTFKSKKQNGIESVENVRLISDPNFERVIAMELLDVPQFQQAKHILQEVEQMTKEGYSY